MLVENWRDTFRKYREQRSLNPTTAFDDAQLAILDIIQALRGVVPVNKIIQAVGDATTPNAASRALRNRLSHKYF